MCRATQLGRTCFPPKGLGPFVGLRITGTICHVKKAEQQGAFDLKSSAVNAGLKYHISVAVFLCVEEYHVTHYRPKSTKHGGNMSLW